MDPHMTRPPSAALVRHGALRGHATVAVGILRSRPSEPGTLGPLANEVYPLALSTHASP
jgi:hypothetical protein